MLEAAAINKPPIEKGCKGTGVEALQGALQDLGYDLPVSTGNGTKRPDGIFGKETDAAVRAFQADQKLAVDGDVGKDTMHALDEECVYNDLRPALHYGSVIDEAITVGWSRPQRMKRIGSGHVPSLLLLSQKLHLTLIDKLPESKREEARREWNRKYLYGDHQVILEGRKSRFEDLAKIKRANTVVLGGASPAAAVAMIAALLLSAVLQNPNARKWPKWPSTSAPPAPTSDPRLWFLAFALTSLIASAVQASIRRNRDAINKCREDNEHLVSGCTEAIEKFAEATGELQKCATVALHSGGQLRFPGFARRAAKALDEYNEALKALAKCLACGPLDPISFD
jgi:hypothetical protein